MREPYNFIQKYFFHILLWIVVTISLGIDANELLKVSKFYFIIYVIAKTIALMVLVYLNLLLFYPKLFIAKKYVIYFICILSITALVGYFNSNLELFVREIRGLKNHDLALIFFIKQFFMAVRYVLTAFFLQITVDFYEQKEKLKRIELEKTIAELNFLKSQINPHFLLNTLNNLYALILEKSEQAGEFVLKLADILKYILAEGKADKVFLKKEILLLKNYIELEMLRKPKADILFSFDHTSNNHQITPLILLPFVENAFKHGLNTVSKSGFIHIYIKTNENLLHLLIENNIPPESNTVAVESYGIGIENVRRRLELFYPNRYKLVLERNNKSFLVSLNLNLV